MCIHRLECDASHRAHFSAMSLKIQSGPSARLYVSMNLAIECFIFAITPRINYVWAKTIFMHAFAFYRLLCNMLVQQHSKHAMQLCIPIQCISERRVEQKWICCALLHLSTEEKSKLAPAAEYGHAKSNTHKNTKQCFERTGKIKKRILRLKLSLAWFFCLKMRIYIISVYIFFHCYRYTLGRRAKVVQLPDWFSSKRKRKTFFSCFLLI